MIQIGETKSSIDTPIEHLTACHRRIEQRLTTLERAGDLIVEDPAAALAAILNGIRFLDSTGALHTADEEMSVFPRLRPHLTTEQCAYLDSLEADHEKSAAIFQRLKQIAAELEQAQTDPVTLQTEYQELASNFAALYRAHIQSEDETLTALARARLLAASNLNRFRAKCGGGVKRSRFRRKFLL